MNNPFAYQPGEPYRYRPPDDPQRMAEERTLISMWNILHGPKPKTAGERWLNRELDGMVHITYSVHNNSWTFWGPSGEKTLTALDFAAHAVPCPPTR